MHPIIFQIKGLGIKIPAYGLMLAIGCLLAIFLINREAKKKGLVEEHYFNLCLYGLIAALIGSRLFHVFFENPVYYFSHPLDIIKIWQGGQTYYGGLIPGFLVVCFLLRKYQLKFFETFDIFAPYLALGSFFGRIGCTLAGCCYGKISHLPWAYAVTNPESFTRPLGISLHPTQLYQAVLNLFTFIILMLLKRKQKFAGQIMLAYLILYPIFRSIVEIFRGDTERGFVIKDIISISQFISLIVAMMAIVAYLYLRKKAVQKLDA